MIKRILKDVLAAATLICLAVFLFSCHGSRGAAEFVIPEEFDTTRDYEITFWAKNDTNITQVEIYHKAIRDFEEIYPNIKVNLRLYTDYGKIYNDVITNISTNTTPNVCITYPDHIATYMTGTGTVVNLDSLMENEKYGLGGTEIKFDSPSKQEIIPKFLDECMINGSYYALPFMRSTEACYVNKTYVEKLGFTLPETLTWDFVWQVSEAATAKDESGSYLVNRQKVMIPFIYKSTDNMMIQMLKQRAAGYSTENGDILLFNDTTKELLYTVAEHAKSGAFSTFKISSYPANFLNAGQCIFAVDSTAGATWMGTNAPLSDISKENIVDFETVVMTPPQFDTDNKQMISQGPSLCIFNKQDSGEVLASFIFAQYLLTNDVQNAYAFTEGYVPVTSKAQSSAEYTDYLRGEGKDNNLHYDIKIKASKLLLENTNNTFVTPVFNGSASLRDASGQLIENVTKAVRRKTEVNDEYIEKLYDDVASLYRIYESNSLSSVSEKELGELPQMSLILLISLAIIWAVIIANNAIKLIKKRKK